MCKDFVKEKQMKAYIGCRSIGVIGAFVIDQTHRYKNVDTERT